jgi:hypothetical protein
LYGSLLEQKRARSLSPFKEKTYSEKVFGFSIGFILRSKATPANFYRKTALGGMYRVAAHRL